MEADTHDSTNNKSDDGRDAVKDKNSGDDKDDNDGADYPNNADDTDN